MSFPTKHHFQNAVLRLQWLNNVKDQPALPPAISTESFNDTTFKRLVEHSHKKKYAFAPSTYTSVRFDGKVRVMQLPHPFPYSEAVDIIANHWLDLKKFLSSANSEIRPLSHYDGRVIKFTSNYATNGTPPPFKLKKPLHKSALIDIDFIKGQVIEIDLSNFFHSIYTHALDWVVTGNRSHNSPSVGSEVDRAFRLINTNRTDGVCVGPALSNIAGEIILHQIDELLENRCSNGELYFTRHIDDITIHCKKGIDVDDLINEINSHLIHFGLSLNHTKTNISTYQDYYIGHIRQNAQQLLATVPSLTSLIDFRILFAHIQANARDLKKHSLMLLSLIHI